MINNVKLLRVHLKMFKRSVLEKTGNVYDCYPNFCLYYDKNKDKYDLPKETVFNEALDVFLG